MSLAKLMQGIRFDGWQSLITGLGDANRDKLESYGFARTEIPDRQLADLWERNDLARTIVNTYPDEMLREPFNVQIESEKNPLLGKAKDGVDAETAREWSKGIHEDMRRLQVRQTYRKAMRWDRLFGGGVVFVGAVDGATDPAEPLREDSIEEIAHLTVFERPHLLALDWVQDPTEERYGKPETFMLVPPYVTGALPRSGANIPNTRQRAQRLRATFQGHTIVHHSRLIIFDGEPVVSERMQQRDGFGDSVLQPIEKILRNHDVTWQAVAHVMQDASQGVFKMKDLHNALGGNADKAIEKRMQIVDIGRSIARALLIDTEEEFERHSADVQNYDKVLDKFMLRVAAAARMPVTILYGQSPAGMNATGESDFQWFYDRVRTKQIDELEPRLRRLIELLMKSKKGPTRGVVPDRWSIHFDDLERMSPKEQSELELNYAQRDKIYIDTGVWTPAEVALSRSGPDGFSPETQIDIDARVEFAKLEMEREKELLENPPQPPPGPGQQPGEDEPPEDGPGDDE